MIETMDLRALFSREDLLTNARLIEARETDPPRAAEHVDVER